MLYSLKGKALISSPEPKAHWWAYSIGRHPLSIRPRPCSLSRPLWSIWILSKLLNLIGCHGNRKDKFARKHSKIFSSEAIRGMNPKLCRNVHNISFYKKCVFYCHCSCAFVAMTKFPLTCNRKSETITETSPYLFGNFCKLSLYNCFMLI